MKKSRLNKKIVLVFVVILIIGAVLICFFMKMNYKNKNLGHNMSNKNIKEIEEYILNISSYEAKLDVTIESNKNKNQYVMRQLYQKDKVSKQTILEPSNIQGMEIINESNKLTIHHSRVNLVTVYENYNYLVDNFLWLNSFIQDYKENQEKRRNSNNRGRWNDYNGDEN